MEDRSLYNNQQSQGISETLQNYIDSLVEEIILEGKPFDVQKKYLKKFSENEGLDYETIEKGITELVETMVEMKTSDSKMLIKLALIQAKDAHVTETTVLNIAQQTGLNESFSVKRKAIAGIIQSLQLRSAKNGIKKSSIEGGKEKVLVKYEYVDLGLPSGTLWATFNVGATKPEESGEFFAWGETSPKTNYGSNNYKYCNSYSHQLTKYCFNSKIGHNGFTDRLFILLSSDDAATVNWGEEWRMPIIEEWEELRDNTSHIWTTLNGVKGCLFTAHNGNTLFLPAVGLREGYEHKDGGDEGYYWSSTGEGPRHSHYTGSVNYFGISAKGCGGQNCYHSYPRYYGFSVRPVRSDTGIALKFSRKDGLFSKISNIFRDYTGY